MLRRNPLTEDEHAKVSTLMREIDDLSKRGRMYASTGGTAPETLRKAARAYNDRVAVLRVMIGNRPVEQLEKKWLYGPVAWSMVVGQEWDLVVRPRERTRATVACNPSTCRNPKHHHAARKNTDIAGAMIAGASAALVGRMIRGNPRKRVFPKKYAAVPSERRKKCPHTHMAYSGEIPCTGVRFCRMCGATEDQIRRARQNSRSKEKPASRRCSSCGTRLHRGESLLCTFCKREGAYAFNRKNTVSSNTSLALKREVRALARELEINLTNMYGNRIDYTKRPAFSTKLFAKGWYKALVRLKKIKREREWKATHSLRYDRPNPYERKNPLASGAWKGWSIKPGGRGFVRRFGNVVVYIYLNRGGRAPNIWTWRVHHNGKRYAGGDVSTDEIARRRVMAVMYGTHKNPDSDMTGTMIVKCCVCKKTMGTKPCLPEHHGKTSHTYCPSCLAAEKEKIRQWRERGRPRQGR